MNFKNVIDDYSFQEWFGYAPQEPQYTRYALTNPSYIAAGHKIEDVYYSFADARAAFIFANSNDFGDLVDKSEQSQLFMKTHFLTTAILRYCICLDLSWQVVWSFIQPSSFKYLVKREYTNIEKECTLENVQLQLRCAISQGGVESHKAEKIKEILNAFNNNSDVKEIRRIYNYLKHNGTIHYKGLGNKADKLMLSVNGQAIPILCRETYELDSIEEQLIKFHFLFTEYFNNLIHEIVPNEYKENKISLIELAQMAIEINEELKKKE